MMMPEDERIDGGWWEFIGKRGRGMIEEEDEIHKRQIVRDEESAGDASHRREWANPSSVCGEGEREREIEIERRREKERDSENERRDTPTPRSLYSPRPRWLFMEENP